MRERKYTTQQQPPVERRKFIENVKWNVQSEKCTSEQFSKSARHAHSRVKENGRSDDSVAWVQQTHYSTFLVTSPRDVIPTILYWFTPYMATQIVYFTFYLKDQICSFLNRYLANFIFIDLSNKTCHSTVICVRNAGHLENRKIHYPIIPRFVRPFLIKVASELWGRERINEWLSEI